MLLHMQPHALPWIRLLPREVDRHNLLFPAYHICEKLIRINHFLNIKKKEMWAYAPPPWRQRSYMSFDFFCMEDLTILSHLFIYSHAFISEWTHGYWFYVLVIVQHSITILLLTLFQLWFFLLDPVSLWHTPIFLSMSLRSDTTRCFRLVVRISSPDASLSHFSKVTFPGEWY